MGHESTVVCAQFSPDNQFIASSGKDRTLCVFERVDSEYVLRHQIRNAHKRIVWSLRYAEEMRLLCVA